MHAGTIFGRIKLAKVEKSQQLLCKTFVMMKSERIRCPYLLLWLWIRGKKRSWSSMVAPHNRKCESKQIVIPSHQTFQPPKILISTPTAAFQFVTITRILKGTRLKINYHSASSSMHEDWLELAPSCITPKLQLSDTFSRLTSWHSMAPLPRTFLPDRFSSLELYRRSLLQLHPLATIETSLTPKRSSSLSPIQENSYLRARTPAPPVRHDPPGSGSFDPNDINNRGILALFALLAASLVLGSIWFFFWAKNGGFRFHKGDWDDYKSTVLRRKGPDGKTLSNATKTTELGGGSVVANIAQEDDGDSFFIKKGAHKPKARAPRGKKNNADRDVRAYRHEKPARVGGLNREADGCYNQDLESSVESSEFSQPTNVPPSPKKKLNPFQTPKKKSTNAVDTPSSTSSHRPLRPNSTSSTPTRSRQSSPRKHTPYRHSNSQSQHSSANSYANTYTEPIDFDSRYATSEATETEQSRGTKAYFHPIPGLGSRAGEGMSGGNGFRRGGGRGRRDSLSDSDGEETIMS